MKFRCSQQALSKALNIVSKAVSTKTTIETLKGILLTVKEGTLTLSSTDMEISIEKTIPVDDAEDGAIVVYAKLFGDIVRKLPNEELFITLTEENIVEIKTSNSEFKISCLEADEFPSIALIEEEKASFMINKENLKDLIKKTVFSASLDESKGVIVGALIEIKKDKLSMIALDGFRMAVCRKNVLYDEEKNIIVAAKILNEVNKIISDIEEDIDIRMIITEKKAMFSFDDTIVIIRLLEGEFIKYNDIIPKEFKINVKINRANLMNSIERASLLAKEGKNNLIKMKIEEDHVIISSRSEGGNVKETIFIEKEGEDLEIGFNSKYMTDVLKALDDEKITLLFNANINPCVIKPEEGNEYEYLVLPVRINSTVND